LGSIRCLAHNLVVTSPRSKGTRLRHIQLVALHEFSALLVVVLQEARVRQQVLNFTEPVDQDSLNVVANRVNATCGGLSTTEIRLLPVPSSVLDEAVVAMAAVAVTAEHLTGQSPAPPSPSAC